MDPRDTTIEYVRALATAGVNRASIGVQDYHPEVQEAINRIQPYETTMRVIGWMREHGIRDINMDLMYGLPHQTVDRVVDMVDKTVALGARPHRAFRLRPRALDEAASKNDSRTRFYPVRGIAGIRRRPPRRALTGARICADRAGPFRPSPRIRSSAPRKTARYIAIFRVTRRTMLRFYSVSGPRRSALFPRATFRTRRCSRIIAPLVGAGRFAVCPRHRLFGRGQTASRHYRTPDVRSCRRPRLPNARSIRPVHRFHQRRWRALEPSGRRRDRPASMAPSSPFPRKPARWSASSPPPSTPTCEAERQSTHARYRSFTGVLGVAWRKTSRLSCNLTIGFIDGIKTTRTADPGSFSRCLPPR